MVLMEVKMEDLKFNLVKMKLNLTKYKIYLEKSAHKIAFAL